MNNSIKRVFSGIQPSGKVHLGNYLGAIKKFIFLQKDNNIQNIYCVADLHSITSFQDPNTLKLRTLEVAAAYLASGIDPSKSIIFNQSKVSQHTELGWIFNCIVQVDHLNRMTQFKNKINKKLKNISVGLYSYPNLMAADILSYNATHVPVGYDQKQHIELCRNIAKKFNNNYADQIKSLGFKKYFFTQPEALIDFNYNKSIKIMNLRDATKKMSSSDRSDMTRININDSSDVLVKKIKKAKTDSEYLPSETIFLKHRPETRNLVNIFAILNDSTTQKVLDEFGGQQFKKFKKSLVELIIFKIGTIGNEMNRLIKDEEYIKQILKSGADKAKVISKPIIQNVKKIVGFIV